MENIPPGNCAAVLTVSPAAPTVIQLAVFHDLRPTYESGEDISVVIECASFLYLTSADWVGLFPANWKNLDEFLVKLTVTETGNSALKGHSGDVQQLYSLHFDGDFLKSKLQFNSEFFQLLMVSESFDLVLGTSKLFRILCRQRPANPTMPYPAPAAALQRKRSMSAFTTSEHLRIRNLHLMQNSASFQTGIALEEQHNTLATNSASQCQLCGSAEDMLQQQNTLMNLRRVNATLLNQLKTYESMLEKHHEVLKGIYVVLHQLNMHTSSSSRRLHHGKEIMTTSHSYPGNTEPADKSAGQTSPGDLDVGKRFTPRHCSLDRAFIGEQGIMKTVTFKAASDSHRQNYQSRENLHATIESKAEADEKQEDLHRRVFQTYPIRKSSNPCPKSSNTSPVRHARQRRKSEAMLQTHGNLGLFGSAGLFGRRFVTQQRCVKQHHGSVVAANISGGAKPKFRTHLF